MKTSKILVIDDEKDLREALLTSLKSAGCLALGAVDGEEGLQRALTHRPDLILLDINMPRMNGHEMLNQLRRDTWGKNVPVILLTNADDATNISTGIGMKGNDYIIKSQTSLETIVKKVKQYLAGYHD